MPANTAQGLPYPLPTEPVAEGAQAIRNLAEALAGYVPFKIAKIGPIADGAGIDFQNIPQLYQNLEVVFHLRSQQAIHIVDVGLRFNNDAGAVYDYEMVTANGTTVAAVQALAATQIVAGGIAGAAESGNYWGDGRIFLPDYRAVDARKAALIQNAKTSPNANQIFNRSITGAWRTLNAPITRVTLVPLSGSGFGSGSWATLYGLP